MSIAIVPRKVRGCYIGTCHESSPPAISGVCCTSGGLEDERGVPTPNEEPRESHGTDVHPSSGNPLNRFFYVFLSGNGCRNMGPAPRIPRQARDEFLEMDAWLVSMSTRLLLRDLEP